jgi:hypothetical protein
MKSPADAGSHVSKEMTTAMVRCDMIGVMLPRVDNNQVFGAWRRSCTMRGADTHAIFSATLSDRRPASRPLSATADFMPDFMPPPLSNRKGGNPKAFAGSFSDMHLASELT